MEQTLAGCLEATLSTYHNVRTEAEVQLGLLKSPQHDPQGQVGIAFVNLLLDQSLSIHIRQSAGIGLRKFVTTRWSPYFDDFAGTPATDPAVKEQIRHTLLSGLSNANRKIRLASSYVISTIAGPDFPDQYAELLPHLIHLLQQGSPDGVHGAMALLCEFVKVEMDEIQLMHVAKEILPILERILSNADQYSAHTRARCVLVFRQCLTTLYMVKESYPQITQEASQTMLPRWLAAMQTLLQHDIANDVHSNWESLGLFNEIFKTLKVAALFRSQFKPLRSQALQSAVSTLSALLPAFQQTYLSNAAEVATPSTAEGDDDVASDMPSLASSVLDFIADASRGPDCRSLFVQSGTSGRETELLQQLVHLLLVYISMTTEDEDNWANDANAFIADEEDETLAYSLRIAGADLLATLIDDFPNYTLRCLAKAFRAQTQEGDRLRANGDEDWWKAHEAGLAAIGNNADAINEVLQIQQTSNDALNLERIFADIVFPNVNNEAPAFLQGRCFVFASQFATALPSDLAINFLDAAIAALETDATSMPVKISAVRTIKNFFRHLRADTVAPYAPRIVRHLGPLLTRASEDTLILIIETIQAVLVQEEDTSEVAIEPQTIGEVVQAVLHVWAQNAKDIVLLSVVSDLLESLAASKQMNVPTVVVQKSMPLLSAAIASSPSESDEPSAVAETAVELSKSVLDGADAASLKGVVGVLCPNLVKVLKTSDDRDVLQNGIECLTVLVKKCSEELLAWHESGSNTSAVEAMLQIIARLLNPSESSESGGLAVGELVVAILRNASDHIGPILPELLKAMVQRLATAETTSFVQSLILPIAYLMHSDEHQAKQVMDLLEPLQFDLQGQSSSLTGLELLARKWVDNAETFQGFWAQRISSLALAKLLDSRRAFLTSAIVRGDILPDNSGIIRTRSRAKTMPHQYTQVPLFAKIAKVLLKEWESATRGAPIASSAVDGAQTPETDDDDGEWDDDEPVQRGGKDNFGFLSDMLGPGGLDALQDADLATEDAADLRDDPVYNMDFKVRIYPGFA